MKKAFAMIFVLLALGGSALLVHQISTDKRAIMARLTDERNNEVIVIGQSRYRLGEWTIELCWRKGKGPWMTYLLDGDANFWRNVELSKSTNSFVVKRGLQIVGQLNTANGSFDYVIRKLLLRHPKDIVVSNDPFDWTKRIYPESSGWDSVWPSSMLESK